MPFTEDVTITEPASASQMRNRVLDGGEGADQVDIESGTEFLHGKLSIPAHVPLTPALATATSSRPQVSTVVAIAERTGVLVATSQVTVMAVPPAPPIASAASAS